MFAAAFSFLFNQTTPTQSGAISAALVAGGGGGGGYEAGSGGGAGGVFSPSSFTVPIGYDLNVIVGAGAAQSGYYNGLQGNNTYFYGYETAGGGAGRIGGDWDNYTSGVDGGSGGGGPLEFGRDVQTTGGLGNVPALTPAQGRNGGSGPPVGVIGGSGGGGGYGGVGGNGTATAGGAGGAGGTISPAGVAQTVAGGGGGAIWTGTAGAGGSGGGGAGGSVSGGTTPGTAGLANTGGGGGGSSGYAYSSAGGSGLVKIWYSGASRAIITGTGNTTTTVGSFTVHTFITSGTIRFSS